MTSSNHDLLVLRNVTKAYGNGARSLTVLHDLSFAIETGETCAIIGPSGSGKTTLLGLCAGLDRPTTGEVYLANHPLHHLSEDELAEVRCQAVGFVFQSFQLIPTLTALENVTVPLELRGTPQARTAALELLQRVGLENRAHHYPMQLSGGEQQRVALARAFIHRPQILFADEPTGNLDDETSKHVIALLFSLNREAGTTLVIVTHDADLAGQTRRQIRLRGGRIVEDTALSNEKSNKDAGKRGTGEGTVPSSNSRSPNASEEHQNLAREGQPCTRQPGQ